MTFLKSFRQPHPPPPPRYCENVIFDLGAKVDVTNPLNNDGNN